MASTTSDSLPSSPSLPTTSALDGAADQELSSSSHHHHHQSLFLPSSSSSPASLYLDSSFHGLLHASSTAMSSSPSPPPPAPPLPPAPAPAKPAKKRPRASRRPPTTVLTTDTSNFRAMVQEFTGFPAPPFAPAPPPAVRPRLFGGPSSFLMRPSPLKYPVLLPPSTCTTTLANTAINASGGSSNNITASTSSLVDALALFAKSNAMPSGAGAAAAAAATSGGSGAADHHYHGIGMGGFNPFDDFDPPAAAAEGEGGDPGGGHGFFSSFATGGDKYGRH
ncbi:hypothetical protein SEVIR_9G386100v4 [Setaria viridis]|uniref:VQ domain-containing protein n=3 Tax=Setaria TaxID=4554 RepID=A0A368SQ17_SETIT|nr:ras-associated and pleckstrin homology domains-containing protein 1 [Setaria italica]XP_034572029.1 ras-associated and pleckstrin homology domains-containing protein 1-like [Setaria viridis]RCV44527.1 hypothetical protein SETIT_9G381000v2 [Setaria italica]TKV95808.1 hypothetical protein SEVIR_9G386100v2 [Setaria viridis]